MYICDSLRHAPNAYIKHEKNLEAGQYRQGRDFKGNGVWNCVAGSRLIKKAVLVASCCGKTQRYLEAIVDEPLESRQSSNHEDPNRKPIPEASETNVAVDSCHGFAAALASCILSSQRLCRHLWEQVFR